MWLVNVNSILKLSNCFESSRVLEQYFRHFQLIYVSFLIFFSCISSFLLVGLSYLYLNTLNAELNPIYHLLALLGAQPILHISRIKVEYHSVE
jgi:hypothetical protein